jgi:uncharacterized membrane protein YraQ (UPF0718 family)
MTTLVMFPRTASATAWQLLPYVVLGVLASEAMRIPLVHSLLEQDMSGDAALAFLIAGPAPPLMGLATIVWSGYVQQVARTTDAC